MSAGSSPQPLAVGEAVQMITDPVSNERLKQSYVASLQTKQSTLSKIELFPVMYDQGEPIIQFTMEEVNNFIKEEGLHQAVVVKFSYGRPDLVTVRKNFSSHFDIHGHYNIGQLEFRHLLIRFDLYDEYVRFLSKSTGYLKSKGEEFLFRTFPWTFGFNPREETSMAVVWISLPGLPPNLFAKRSLMSIAAAVGKPLAVDKATQDRTRPSTARVKVIVDLLKKHPKKITLQILDSVSGKIVELHQLIVFDNLPKYCVYCKHQGHDLTSCRIRKQKSGIEEGIEEDLDNNQSRNDVNKIEKLKGDARYFLNNKRAAQRAKYLPERRDNTGDKSSEGELHMSGVLKSHQNTDLNVKVGQCSSVVQLGNVEKQNVNTALNENGDRKEAGQQVVVETEMPDAINVESTAELDKEVQNLDNPKVINQAQAYDSAEYIDNNSRAEKIGERNGQISKCNMQQKTTVTSAELVPMTEGDSGSIDTMQINVPLEMYSMFENIAEIKHTRVESSKNAQSTTLSGTTVNEYTVLNENSGICESIVHQGTGKDVLIQKEDFNSNFVAVMDRKEVDQQVFEMPHASSFEPTGEHGKELHVMDNPKVTDLFRAYDFAEYNANNARAEQIGKRDGQHSNCNMQQQSTVTLAEVVPITEAFSGTVDTLQITVPLEMPRTIENNAEINHTKVIHCSQDAHEGQMKIAELTEQQQPNIHTGKNIDAMVTYHTVLPLQSREKASVSNNFDDSTKSGQKLSAQQMEKPSSNRNEIIKSSNKQNVEKVTAITLSSDSYAALAIYCKDDEKEARGVIQKVQSYTPISISSMYAEGSINDSGEFLSLNGKNRHQIRENMRDMVIKSKLWDQCYSDEDDKWDEGSAGWASDQEGQQDECTCTGEESEATTKPKVQRNSANMDGNVKMSYTTSNLNHNAPVFIPKNDTTSGTLKVTTTEIDQIEKTHKAIQFTGESSMVGNNTSSSTCGQNQKIVLQNMQPQTKCNSMDNKLVASSQVKQNDMEGNHFYEEGEGQDILMQCRKNAARMGDLSPTHSKTSKKNHQRDRSWDDRMDEDANKRKLPIRIAKQKQLTQNTVIKPNKTKNKA